MRHADWCAKPHFFNSLLKRATLAPIMSATIMRHAITAPPHERNGKHRSQPERLEVPCDEVTVLYDEHAHWVQYQRWRYCGSRRTELMKEPIFPQLNGTWHLQHA